jgi:transcriptional regulator with XRE-family HTH domain
MDKLQLRQVFVDNVERLMKDRPGLDTQTALAKKTGLTQGYISELLRCMSAPTTDTIAVFADAFDCEPWELLTDSETTRENAIRKILMGPRVSNERAAETLPPPPTKAAAIRRKKAGGRE